MSPDVLRWVVILILDENTKAWIQKKIKEGRGQGTGSAYQPWLRVGDFPSNGTSHRITYFKQNRVCHFFSTLEAKAFYLFEWADQVKSSWEVSVSYDPNCLDQIYVHIIETKRAETCNRILRDEEKYQGYSMMEYMTANGELKELVAKGKAESERYQAAAQQKIREIAEGAVRRMAGEPERRAPVKGVRKNRKEAQRAEQEQKRTSVLESGLPEIKPQQVARQVPTKEDTQSEHDALNPLQEKILEKDLLLTGWGSDDDEI